jgi:hypothetical protein
MDSSAAGDALVLLAGLPESRISSQPVGFRDMPTYVGRLSCTVERTKEGSNQLVANLSGTCPAPSGGIHLTVPAAPAIHATVNGKASAIDTDGCIVVKELPARIEVVAGSHEGQ